MPLWDRAAAQQKAARAALVAARRVPRTYTRLPSAELKVMDCVITPAAAALPNIAGVAYTEPGVASTGYTCLNGILQQGAAFYQRIGQKLVVKNVEVRLCYVCTAAPTQAWVRTMLVFDRSPNAVAPALADIIYSQPAGAATSNSMASVVNRGRFVVLYDRQWDCASTDASYITEVNIRKRCNLVCHYGANAGTIADIRSGAFYLISFTLAAAGGVNYSAGGAHARISFYDV